MINGQHYGTHGLHRRRDFFRRLAGEAHRYEEARDLRRRPVSGKDRVERPSQEFTSDAFAALQTSEDLLEWYASHKVFSQFSIICIPCSVRMDSGWNWTPSTA